MSLSQFKTPFHKARIIGKEKISAHVFHLQVQSDEIKTLEYIPGMHMKVLVGLNEDATQNNQVRSYSIWDFDANAGTLDLAVCTHSSGLGSQWVEAAEANDDFYFFLKNTLTADDSAQNYFFIGDITTLGHFYKIRRSLSSGKKIFSFIYGNETDFFPDLDGSKPFDFYMLPSDKHLPAPIDFLKEKISHTLNQIHLQQSQENRELTTDNYSIVYIGGDARVCSELTIYFTRKLGWHPSQIKMKSFWNPDKVREEN